MYVKIIRSSYCLHAKISSSQNLRATAGNLRPRGPGLGSPGPGGGQLVEVGRHKKERHPYSPSISCRNNFVRSWNVGGAFQRGKGSELLPPSEPLMPPPPIPRLSNLLLGGHQAVWESLIPQQPSHPGRDPARRERCGNTLVMKSDLLSEYLHQIRWKPGEGRGPDKRRLHAFGLGRGTADSNLASQPLESYLFSQF